MTSCIKQFEVHLYSLRSIKEEEEEEEEEGIVSMEISVLYYYFFHTKSSSTAQLFPMLSKFSRQIMQTLSIVKCICCHASVWRYTYTHTLLIFKFQLKIY